MTSRRVKSGLKARQSLIGRSQLRYGGMRLDLAPEVAGDEMILLVYKSRFFRSTAGAGVGAARAEATARRRLVRARDIALKDHSFSDKRRIRYRNRREQRPGVGMARLGEEGAL